MLTGIYEPVAGEIFFDGRSNPRTQAATGEPAGHRPHVPEHPLFAT